MYKYLKLVCVGLLVVTCSSCLGPISDTHKREWLAEMKRTEQMQADYDRVTMQWSR